MPDIKHLLSEEIRRLAKKEVKLAVAPLQKTISEQKKTIQMLLRKMGQEDKAAPSSVSSAATPEVCDNNMNLDEKLPRFNAKRITRLRMKLGLSKKDFATIIGVTQFTIINWETSRCTPRDHQKKRLAELLTMGKRAFGKMLADSFPSVKTKSADRKTSAKKAVKSAPALPVPPAQ